MLRWREWPRSVALPLLTPLRLALVTLFILACALISLAHFHPDANFSITFHPSPPFHPHISGISEPENRHLSAAQCLDRYPELYLEADRAREWYSRKGGITKAQVDEAEQEGQARLVILDNKLFVKSFNGGINSRTQAAIAAVYSTLLTSPEPLPDVDFVIQTGDAGSGDYPHFALCRTESQKNLWLMPDFGFFSWPEPGVGAYSQVRAEALVFEHELGYAPNVSSSWPHKIPKLMWRGVPMVEVRQDLLRASREQEWSDVQELNWGAVNQDGEEREKNHGDLKTPAEHCQYAFLAHVEGYTYSGRLKYLQQCRSLVVTHPLTFIQHYHHLMISDPDSPHQNIVEVPLPLESNLPDVMSTLLDPDNADMVARIVNNNWEDMREHWISPAANECYHRYALRAYAEVQTFRPELEGRAVPYESFVLTGTTHWDPHR